MLNAPIRTLIDEVTDFLATTPTLEQIVAYKLPEELEQRGLALLQINSEGKLTQEENEELQEFLRIGHVLDVLTLKAQLKLACIPYK